MELSPRISAKVINTDENGTERTYEFTFPNGAPASEILQSLADMHKKILEEAKKNEEKESAGEVDADAKCDDVENK